jgi:hypothetical protein
MTKGFIECKTRFLYPMMKMRNYRQYKFQDVNLSFKEGRESTMNMVVEVGEGEIRRFFRRATSQRERSRYFDAARAKTLVQTRIDTSLWSSKGKSEKEAIEWAKWKWFHVSGILGTNADNSYFISAVKQTQ